MKYINIVICFFSFLIANDTYCTLPDLDYNSARNFYNIGDTISLEDQAYEYDVCHGDGNYGVGTTFRLSDFSGEIILISMNATW